MYLSKLSFVFSHLTFDGIKDSSTNEKIGVCRHANGPDILFLHAVLLRRKQSSPILLYLILNSLVNMKPENLEWCTYICCMKNVLVIESSSYCPFLSFSS